MPALTGKCEQYINGAWVDLSSRVSWGDGGAPVEISRGLDDSGAPTAGRLTLTMENRDGALTPGGAGTWGHYLVRWRPMRVSVLVSGVWRQRFYGYVDSEPLSWPTGDASHCVVIVTNGRTLLQRAFASVGVRELDQFKTASCFLVLSKHHPTSLQSAPR